MEGRLEAGAYRERCVSHERPSRTAALNLDFARLETAVVSKKLKKKKEKWSRGRRE